MIKNYLRTLLGIRKKRAFPKAGPIPLVGATLVRGQLSMPVTTAVSPEQWEWLTLLGWRNSDMRIDRRRYVRMPTDAFAQLIGADRYERDTLHQQLIASVTQRDRK